MIYKCAYTNNKKLKKTIRRKAVKYDQHDPCRIIMASEIIIYSIGINV